MQLHSAYLHSFGVWPAVRLAESTLRRAVMAGAVEPSVSRIDLYADVEGWPLQVDDLRRFVSRGRGRGCHPVAEEEDSDRFWQLGRNLSGIEFGRRGGGVYVRIFDKTAEIKRRGNSWLPALWGERKSDGPVWRIEFEVRRKKLRERGLCIVEEVLEGQQDLWRYVTHQWLTYRTPQRDARVRRWPVDPIWQQVQAIRLHPTELGVVRGQLAAASEERLLIGAALCVGRAVAADDLAITPRSTERRVVARSRFGGRAGGVVGAR
ncbi:MAG: hypothetical protein ACREQM_00440, partial [Candidatus Dormibacteraceae bacterium]